MRVVVDLQAFPPRAGGNGVNRYSAALVSAMLRHPGDHEVKVVVTHSSEELIEELQDRFPDLFRRGAFHLSAIPLISTAAAAPRWHRMAAELVREHALLQFQPDVVLCAPLTGPADVVTLSELRCVAIPTAIALSAAAAATPPGAATETGVDTSASPNGLHVKPRWTAELVLVPSQYSRSLLVDAVELSPDRVWVVQPAVNEQFSPAVASDAQIQAVRTRFAAGQEFILCINTGASRGGVEQLLEAFGLLPRQVREVNRLVIVDAGNPGEEERLLRLGHSKGLADSELVIASDIRDDELAELYKSCKLLVVPGWDAAAVQRASEGMSCGTAVLGPDHPQIREIIGRGDALFDAGSDRHVSDKIYEILTRSQLREELKLHAIGQVQRFSAQTSARLALEALERLHTSRSSKSKRASVPAKARPRMAYVSPLPPERSGIADYSAELLPELARYFDIELVTDLSEIADPVLDRQFRRILFRDFERTARDYDAILYHIGNSPFHVRIPSLLERYPGTVVLHDFFLSHLFNRLESTDGISLWRNLYMSHGYSGLIARAREGSEAALWAYPCNLAVLQHAAGVIVHSEHVAHLARQWFGIRTEQWKVIPQLRRMPRGANREKARKALGIPHETFLVCSFGFLSEAKLNDLLFRSWIASSVSRQPNCCLVFVGGDGFGRPYQVNGLPSSQIRATGYVSKQEYDLYLAAADVGVQLRSDLSRGETPRSVLDCMAHGMATVVNSHPALMDLPDDSVLRMKESSEQELIAAFETLYREPGLRAALGRRAQQYVKATRSPAIIASKYAEAVRQSVDHDPVSLTNRIVSKGAELVASARPSNEELASVAASIAENTNRNGIPQLLVDVTILVMVGDYRTGIQRVTRGILAHLLENPPPGWRIEPVYRRHRETYRYARSFVGKYLGLERFTLEDAAVAVNPGDIFLGLDWDAGIAIDQRAANWVRHHRQRGMRTVFTVYDLLPLQHPEWFKPDMPSAFHGWLSLICRLTDAFACISRAVADDMLKWLEEFSALAPRAFDIGYFQLGSDIESSWASQGLSPDNKQLMATLKGREVLLMVGTVEPRKGHGQALAAIESLWAAGEKINLVICGRQGWMVDSLAGRLRSHPELGRRLFWLEQASDEVLQQLYSTASALLMASEGEGFGLPLVEAAHHALPIISRDVPVFREVAGENAFYFSGNDPTKLAAALVRWFELYRRGEHPRSSRPPTWQQSTQQLLRIALGGTAYRRWQGSRTRVSRLSTPDWYENGAIDHVVSARRAASDREPHRTIEID